MSKLKSEFFGPSGCDEFGNTYYPYIIQGTASTDGWSVAVEAPDDFKHKWPTVSTSFVTRTNDSVPRRLGHDEVKQFVAANRAAGRDSLREELSALQNAQNSAPRLDI